MFTRSRHAPSAVAVAVALLVTAGCASGGGRDDRVVPAPGPTSLTTGASPTTPAAQATRVGAVVPEDPVRLVLPSGTPVPVTSVRTTANGVLDVPSDVEAAGWWPGGSRIGDPFGSTLIAAHVDSTAQGVGPFASLLSVARGIASCSGPSASNRCFGSGRCACGPRDRSNRTPSSTRRQATDG